MYVPSPLAHMALFSTLIRIISYVYFGSFCASDIMKLQVLLTLIFVKPMNSVVSIFNSGHFVYFYFYFMFTFFFTNGISPWKLLFHCGYLSLLFLIVDFLKNVLTWSSSIQLEGTELNKIKISATRKIIDY